MSLRVGDLEQQKQNDTMTIFRSVISGSSVTVFFSSGLSADPSAVSSDGVSTSTQSTPYSGSVVPGGPSA